MYQGCTLNSFLSDLVGAPYRCANDITLNFIPVSYLLYFIVIYLLRDILFALYPQI